VVKVKGKQAFSFYTERAGNPAARLLKTVAAINLQGF
jgi:hypothetical protein